MDNSLLFNRSDIAKDWHARGFSCGVWIDHAGREWSYQAQETDELFMMMSGELELEIGGQSILPLVGEEILIPTGIPHMIRNDKGKTARWLYGQRRETVSVPHPPNTTQERSFHPELKRKRRLEKRIPTAEASKDV
jgi:cupin 2 domain-containing protein